MKLRVEAARWGFSSSSHSVLLLLYVLVTNCTSRLSWCTVHFVFKCISIVFFVTATRP